MKKRKYVREKPLAEAEADPPGRQALEGGANEPLMLPEGRTAGQKLLPEPEQKKLLTAGDADEKTMMSAFAENTGQARGSTEINTEAPEIEGWKGGKGQATGQATQGGKDTLGLEGARDAEAKDFAMIVEAPEADNKVMVPDGNATANLPNMEVGSGAPAIDSGRIEKDELGNLLINQQYKVLETKSAEGANSEWANRGYDMPPVKPGTIVYVVEAGKDEYVRLFNKKKGNIAGRWVMRKSDIQGLTLDEIKNKFAIPTEIDSICSVKFPPNIRLEVSIVNPLPEVGEGGGIQFDTMDEFPKPNWFINPRELR